MCDMRIVLGWVGAVVVLTAAIAAGVAVANATVFSASAFVRGYLDALDTGRIGDALALPGVDAAGLDDRMLDPLAPERGSSEVLGETRVGEVHEVAVATEATGLRGTATLRVERIGTLFGLFPEWGFASSPVTALEVTLTGDARFTVGELPLAADGGGPVAFAALTPAVYRFTHESEYLRADPVTVAATGGAVPVELEVVANNAFASAAEAALERALAACTAQTVLFPTGCPFGHAIENRVISEPEWTIVRMPDAQVLPSDRFGVWTVPATDGVAGLRVEVQSLFDGSVSVLEREVPFDARYLVAFDDDGIVLVPASP